MYQNLTSDKKNPAWLNLIGEKCPGSSRRCVRGIKRTGGDSRLAKGRGEAFDVSISQLTTTYYATKTHTTKPASADAKSASADAKLYASNATDTNTHNSNTVSSNEQSRH